MTKPRKTSKVRNWYLRNSNDRLGKEINPDLTFEQLWQGLNNPQDKYTVYDLLGVGDSIIRETVFTGLVLCGYADNYEQVYTLWLNS